MEIHQPSSAKQDSLSEASVTCAAPLYEVMSSTLPLPEITVENLEAARAASGADLAIIFDISPLGLTPQELSDKLARNPRVIVCDHHNACAPEREVPGREVTAAEVIINTIPRLAAAGILRREGPPAKLLICTNSMNVDPDAFISRFLIEAYADDKLREAVWKPEVLELLVQAARFGDTTFFGGADPDAITKRGMKPEERLAFALLQSINDEKERLVIAEREQTALINHNIWTLAGRLEKQGVFQNKSVEGFAKIRKALEADLAALPHSAEERRQTTLEILQQRLGADFTDLETFRALVRAESNAAHGMQDDSDTAERLLRRHQMARLVPRQVREVFVGRARDDLFGAPHPSLWNPATIDRISQSISERIPGFLFETQLADHAAGYFLAGLGQVRTFAVHKTMTAADPADASRQISVTIAERRLDADLWRPFYARETRIYDWLREASAAFGSQWLHLMDRNGSFVMSTRFPRDGEVRPYINLADAQVQKDLISAEAAAATAAGELPVNLIIKANLWLTQGKMHITREELLDIVFRNWERVFSTEAPPTEVIFHSIKLPDGSTAPFDGARFAVAA